MIIPYAQSFYSSFSDGFSALDPDRIEFTYDYNNDFMAGYLPYQVEASCNAQLKYKSSFTVFEKIIKCTVNENELNYTYNKTTLVDPSDPFSNIKPIFISNEFTPYVTSIGLYNEANELLAIAKFDYPVHIPKNTSISFVIRMDF